MLDNKIINFIEPHTFHILFSKKVLISLFIDISNAIFRLMLIKFSLKLLLIKFWLKIFLKREWYISDDQVLSLYQSFLTQFAVFCMLSL